MTAVTREDFSCAAATNESAYRRVTVPVLRIDAGPGPAVALMAGVHGDEWEGQAAILELWHQLRDPEPRHGLSAARRQRRSFAGWSPPVAQRRRQSQPAFLGPARGYTESVAAALEAKLLPRVQALVDVHSGGASLRYLPSSVITRYGRDALDPRLPALARAFGLPQCIYFRGTEAGSMPAAASRHGVLRLSAEIGGGAETGQALVDRCREGLLGCLHELGLLNRELARPDPPALYDLDAPPRPCARTGPAFSFPASSLASASRRVSAWAG